MVAIVKEHHGAKYLLADIDGAKEKGKLRFLITLMYKYMNDKIEGN